MNDELLHISLLAAYGNAFLAGAPEFLPAVPGLFAAQFQPAQAGMIEGEAAWFDSLARGGCRGIALSVETGAEDWTRTAFPNGVPGWELVCLYDDGAIAWRRYWNSRLVDGAYRWYAVYTQAEEPAAPPVAERIGAQARFEHLQALLGMLASLSGAIRAYGWKARFTSLHDNMDYFRSRALVEASLLPKAYSDEARKLYAAATAAWVFGAAGSWNDEPPALAAASAMETTYNDLTGELYSAMLNAFKCAVGKGNIER